MKAVGIVTYHINHRFCGGRTFHSDYISGVEFESPFQVCHNIPDLCHPPALPFQKHLDHNRTTSKSKHEHQPSSKTSLFSSLLTNLVSPPHLFAQKFPQNQRHVNFEAAITHLSRNLPQLPSKLNHLTTDRQLKESASVRTSILNSSLEP